MTKQHLARRVEQSTRFFVGCSNRIILIRLEVLHNTIMTKIQVNQQIILSIFIKGGAFSSSQIHAELLNKGGKISLVTVKR